MQKLLDIIKAFVGRYWLLLIVAVILLIITFRGCKTLPSHRDDKASSDSLARAYAGEKEANLAAVAQLAIKEKQWQTRFDSLSDQAQALKKDLSVRAQIVYHTLSHGDAIAIRRDTAAILVNWDSLRAEVKAGLPVVITKDSISEALVNACVQRGMIKDTLIIHWQGLFYKADTAYALQRAKYASLYADYTKANFRLKFNKTLSRGLALALLAAGAKIFIFK
jgi:hypothetical protein